jgi:hypothetical protein
LLWRNGIRTLAVPVAVAVIAGVAPGVAAAETFKVSTPADGDDKECIVDCTLREAVTLAGAGDQVDVPAGTYLLTGGELFLTTDTIVGDGARSTIIDGGDKSRVLWVTDGLTRVSGVTIRRGNGEGREPSGIGGGIFVESGGGLTLIESAVMQNVARTGGGIGSAGDLNIIGSTVSANRAADGRGASGGGIAETQSGSLDLVNATVSANTADGVTSEGGGVHSEGSLLAVNATLAANRAASGGGLFVEAPEGGSASVNNTVVDGGTGGACGGPGLAAVTSHHNVVSDESCGFKNEGDRVGVDPQLAGLDDYGGPTPTHALLPASPAVNAGSSCAKTDQRGVLRPQPAGGLCDAGAFEYRAPMLTVVTQVFNDDGGTLTPEQLTVHVLLGKLDVKGSPGAGSSNGTIYTLDAFQTYTVVAEAVPGYSFAVSGDCPPNGNVGLAEGQNKSCTITARDQPATLRVITTVVNDDGGTRTSSDFSTHVRSSTAEVASAPGNAAGTAHSLDAGSYVVSADAVSGYAFAFSGDCGSGGAIALAIGEVRSCTITADDAEPPVTASLAQQQGPPPSSGEQLPPPVAGKKVNAVPKSGTVKVKLPGTAVFVELVEGQQLPVGTVVDARKGHVTLVAAADKSGGTATAEFWAGIFKIGQTGGAKPITTLELTEKLSCPKPGKANAAARKKKRRLWGAGTGRFRTDGEYSSATVRGTQWLVEDSCNSTLTRVVKGSVSVRDFVKKKTVIVKAGKKYVAKRQR